MNQGNGIPQSWEWSKLGKICEKPQYGWTTKASPDGNLHLLRTTDITSGTINWDNVPFCLKEPENKEKYLLEDDDIVISRAGSVGFSHLIRNPKEAVFASYLIRFKPNKVIAQYLAYFLQSSMYWRAISETKLGIAIPNVNATKLSQIDIPIPPLPEQKRIVAKIEELFTQLDAGVTELHTAKVQLKRYRQAVLKAAVEGELTREWREAHRDELEPASELLERILAERRVKWEEEELAKMRARGKEPKDDKWKGKYKEPKQPGINGLPKLPNGWKWASIEQTCDRIVDCLHSTPKFIDKGLFCVDTNWIKPGRLVYEKARYVGDDTFVERNRRMTPKKGDVLFSREGALLGIAVQVPDNIKICLGQRMMVFRLGSNIESRYFETVLNSSVFRSQFIKEITGTASPHLNIRDIRLFGIPVPPSKEQELIVAMVERRLSVADEIEKQLDKGLVRAERLRQSILQQAFEGKLVPQDPKDEPASGLIEQIKAKKKKTAVQLTLMGDQS